MKNLVNSLYVALVAGNQKAIVGLLAPLLIGAIAFTGISGDMSVKDAMSLALTGIMTGIGVWLKRNR